MYPKLRWRFALFSLSIFSDTSRDLKQLVKKEGEEMYFFGVLCLRCGLTLVALAGIDLVKVPVFLWRWKVLQGVEVKLGLKIICRAARKEKQLESNSDFKTAVSVYQ